MDKNLKVNLQVFNWNFGVCSSFRSHIVLHQWEQLLKKWKSYRVRVWSQSIPHVFDQSLMAKFIQVPSFLRIRWLRIVICWNRRRHICRHWLNYFLELHHQSLDTWGFLGKFERNKKVLREVVLTIIEENRTKNLKSQIKSCQAFELDLWVRSISHS